MLIKKSFALLIVLGLLISSAAFLVILNLFLPKLSVENLDVDLQFNPANAYTFIKNQTEDIGNRIPGTSESKECVQFFISEFQKIDPTFSYYYHNFTVQNVSCSNILFKVNEARENIIILSAHFDSRARATKHDDHINEPVPGANDGASGSAVLMELSSVLYEKKDDLDCQIWFLFFDAEDQGTDISYGIKGWEWCEGSKRFVSNLNNFYNNSNESFDCMILLDMVGGTGLQFINEQYSTSSLLDEIFAVGRALGYTNAFPINPEVNSILDDHKAFIDVNIPSADLIINFWNNPSWPYHHTVNDTIQHISHESLDITGKTVEQYIYNNYLNLPWNTYQGNYPWNRDRPLLNSEILLQILFIVGLISIVIIIYLIHDYWKHKKN